MTLPDGPRLPAAYLMPGTSSFSDFLSDAAPDLLPSRRAVPQGHAGDLAPHATTIVAENGVRDTLDGLLSRRAG